MVVPYNLVPVAELTTGLGHLPQKSNDHVLLSDKDLGQAGQYDWVEEWWRDLQGIELFLSQYPSR